MKAKIFGLLGLSILAIIMFMGAVSAAVEFVPSTIPNQTILHGQTSTTFSFQLNETSGDIFTLSNWVKTSTQGTLTLSSEPTTLNPNQTIFLSATLSSIPSDFIGTITGNVSVGDNSTAITTLPFSIIVTAPQEILDCSTIENPGNLDVKKIDFKNNGFSHNEFGKDDEWFTLDEIEVDFEIENDGNYDVDDIEIEWGIYALDREEWLIDLDEEDDFNLKNGKEETLIVSFKLDNDLDIDLEDFSDDTDNYRFYVVANGVIDDNDYNEDFPTGSEDTCAFGFKTAEIFIESDFVVLDNIDFPETVMCGETVQITADVWNIGDSDQDEVSVDLVSKGLGLDIVTLIGDIDAFDKDEFTFTFTVPEDAEEKTHTLRFQVWDEDNDVYENDFDEDESEFFLPLKVEGNCAVVDSGVLISASLESEAKAGKEMIISVLLTNTADVTRSFTMQASGYDAWAEISELPGLLTLNADSVGEALFKFDIKKGISGEQTFLVMVYSDNKLIATQPVSINVESAKPLFGITGLVTTDNAYLWGIGLLNIILIVIIILVAVRIARRK